MSLTLDSFRSIASLGERGYVKAEGQDQLKQFGNSRLFGEIAKVTSSPSERANADLRTSFVNLLKAEYGEKFAAYQKVKLDQASGKPLSIAEIKTALLAGDAQLAAKKEIIGNAASQFVQKLGLVADPSKGKDVPGLEDAIGSAMSDVIGQLNGRALDNDTGIAMGVIEVLPREVRQRIDQRIHDAIVTAHGDPKTARALTLDEVRSIVTNTVKNDPDIRPIVDRKLELLRELDGRNLTGASKDYAIADLLRGRDASIDDFMVRTKREAPATKGTARMTAPTSRRDLTNPSLDKALKTSTDGTGKPGDFFKPLTSHGSKVDHQFHVNREVLGHFAEKVKNTNPELAKSLGQRALGHMIRFAISKNDGDTKHENPIVGKEAGNYTRSGGTGLTNAMASRVANSIGVPVENLLPVTDGRVIEVIKRDLATKDIGSVFTLSGSSPEQEGKALHDIVASALSSNKPVFVDVTSFMAGTLQGHQHDFEELKTAVDIARTFLKDVITASVEDYVKVHNETHEDKLDPKWAKAEVEARLTLGSILTIGGQDVLFTDMNAGISIVPGQLNINNTMQKFFKEMVGHNGFTVGPNQVLENWIGAISPKGDPTGGLAGLSGTFGFPTAKIDFSKAGALSDIGSVDGLMKRETGSKFAGLATSGESGMIKTLPSIALAMLGKLEEKGMHRAFSEAGIPELQNYLLNHIESQMAVALDAVAKGDQTGFVEAMELIQADIATMTAVTKPYGNGDFQSAMLEQWNAAKMGAPEKVVPKFSITNSGMRSLASVLSGIEKTLAPGSSLNVAIAKNSYYESAHNLSTGRAHKTFEMSDTDPSTSMGGFDVLKGGEKVNLLVTEFHHNIAMGVKDYAPVPVAEQIKQLLGSDHVSPKLTVAIDNTISVPNGEDMRTLLADPEIAKALSDGRLNIVTYRSAQKFDMAGYDNYNGGIAMVLNNGSFQTFEDGMANVGGEQSNISDVNYQGLTLFQDASGKELTDYRNGIIANTKAFTDLLKPEDRLTDDLRGANFIQFTPNSDPSAVFLDMRSPMLGPSDSRAGDLYAAMQTIYQKIGQDPSTGKAIATRPSFGFAHSNVTIIGSDRFRFNPGLEKTSDMAAHKGVVDDVNTLFRAVEKAMPELMQGGRSAPVQMTEFLRLLAFSGVPPHPLLASVMKGIKDDASVNDRIVAAGILKKYRIDNLASEVLSKAEALAMTGSQRQDLETMRATVGRPIALTGNIYRMAINSFGQGLALGSTDQVELRVKVTQLDAMRRDMAANGRPGASIPDIVAFTTAGLEHLDRSKLSQIADDLGRTARLLPNGDSARVLAEAIADEVGELRDGKPMPGPVTPGSIAASLSEIFIAKSGTGYVHAMGMLTSMGQDALSRRGSSETQAPPSPFGTNADMQQLAADIVRGYELATDLKLSDAGMQAVRHIAPQLAMEFPGVNPGLQEGDLKGFFVQTYMRNMQTMMPPIFEAIGKADMSVEADREKLAKRLTSLANELEKNVATQSGNIAGMAGFLLDARLLDTLPAADRQQVEALGRNLMKIREDMNVTGGMADRIASFASQLRRDPLTVATEISKLA